MNQAELTTSIADAAGITKKQAELAVKHLGELAQSTVKSGGELTLPGIGKITVKASAARTGRNPATGDAIQIPAKNKPAFTAAKALKDAANS